MSPANTAPPGARIVKVTQSMAPNDPEPTSALIFAAGRNESALQPLTDELRAKLNGRQQAYFYAERGWIVGDEAPAQGW